MNTANLDLPIDIKNEVIEELKLMKWVLDENIPIGNGSFGYVYRTRNIITGCLGACKVIVIAEDLPRNIGTLTVLAGCPGIVPIRYSKMSSEFVMIGMEYCVGGSLEKFVIERNGETIDQSFIKSLAHQILLAMFDYSEKGIVHRDLKPENILIDSHGEVKISDFGLAVETNGQSRLSTVTIAGTKRYLSPELEDNESQSIKSDLWAFGVVLLELAYGKESFRTSVITAMDNTRIIDEFRNRGGYSREMGDFISICFKRERVNRATVEELLKHRWFDVVQLNPLTSILNSNSAPPITAVRSGNNS